MNGEWAVFVARQERELDARRPVLGWYNGKWYNTRHTVQGPYFRRGEHGGKLPQPPDLQGMGSGGYAHPDRWTCHIKNRPSKAETKTWAEKKAIKSKLKTLPSGPVIPDEPDEPDEQDEPDEPDAWDEPDEPDVIDIGEEIDDKAPDDKAPDTGAALPDHSSNANGKKSPGPDRYITHNGKMRSRHASEYRLQQDLRVKVVGTWDHIDSPKTNSGQRKQRYAPPHV